MFAALLSGSVANAQNDPVVMTINGQPVTRSEFEYSYNKNNSETVVDKKSVDEYAELFINYKLKSVAHIPINAMIYKTLNTFIDDMFSFVIKMPVLHRIACFRDDIIFFIYLYQMWIYPVDKTRKNEFGYSALDIQKAQKKEGATVAKHRGKTERLAF